MSKQILALGVWVLRESYPCEKDSTLMGKIMVGKCFWGRWKRYGIRWYWYLSMLILVSVDVPEIPALLSPSGQYSVALRQLTTLPHCILYNIMPERCVKVPLFKVPLFQVPMFQVPLFKVLLFKVPLFKLPQFKIPLFKVPLFQVPLFKVPLFKVPLFKVPLFKVPLFKVPLFKVPLFKVPLV